ncbi:MAG: leucine-rich repeat domain-containing protein, partial [Synergistaceae bacterium]|nr:leucine-rich repeat domain-containing protein [Synergistaceae bacterium]
MAVDETNFPDDNFRSYISGNLDKDGDGSLSDEEIAAVTNIDVSGKSISSLKGIEWFAALETLHCSGNSLTELDVSNNTTLTTLYCNYNQLPALDVSKNTTLTTLYCYSNQLTELDLSNNTDLTYLWCHNNRLTELDVSKNTALTQLRCYDNQ